MFLHLVKELIFDISSVCYAYPKEIIQNFEFKKNVDNPAEAFTKFSKFDALNYILNKE